MSKRTSLRSNQKNTLRLKNRFLLITSGTVVAAMLLIGIQFRKKSNKNYFKPVITSDTRVYYNWDTDATSAHIGPDAISISQDAYITSPGSLDLGLSSGGSKDINLKIPKELLDVEGLEVSIDFQRDEPDAYFISRGEEFLFGMRKGQLGIRYTIISKKKGKETISANNIFEVPDDDHFRNYKFKYDPNLGLGVIYVNNEKVWESKKRPNSSLYWKKAASVYVGKYMDGNGSNKPLIDNLVINEIKPS